MHQHVLYCWEQAVATERLVAGGNSSQPAAAAVLMIM
jgi:hypothetical protein